MVRLLYLYPEEWTGRRARELHTLRTCLALADAGVEVVLLTAGGLSLSKAVSEAENRSIPTNFQAVGLSRRWGPIRSAHFFQSRVAQWLSKQKPFDFAYLIHLKAVPCVVQVGLPYWWEAHEVFAETPPQGSPQEKKQQEQEKQALNQAAGRIATSEALAEALQARYASPGHALPFHIVPHGGDWPMESPVFDPQGPCVYAGSLADWKGLPQAIRAAAQLNLSMRVIGGSAQEWKKWEERHRSSWFPHLIEWHPRVAPRELPRLLHHASVALCPTLSEKGTGHYSLPMKLFDYARCGLPCISTALPSLKGLGVESWCRLVTSPTLVQSWRHALQQPRAAEAPEEALAWARRFTWKARGEKLMKLFVSAL